jgi:hypothetical protein
VTEPSLEDTISILRGLKEKYEVHHGVRIADTALVSGYLFSSLFVCVCVFQFESGRGFLVRFCVIDRSIYRSLRSMG